jgi:hypothetical protein
MQPTDEPIELSHKKIKEYLNDTAPILRRGVDDPLPPIIPARLERKGADLSALLTHTVRRQSTNS